MLKELEIFKNHVFRSSSGKTDEFKAFVKYFRKELTEQVKREGLELVKFNTGHFYVSGFVRNPDTGEYAYFSVSDVRFFRNEWCDNILIRTAKDDSDYHGGVNMYSTLEELGGRLMFLTS